MKCEKCGNEYPSQYFFTTPTICTECFKRLPVEEQQRLFTQLQYMNPVDESTFFRVGFGLRFGAAFIDIVLLYIVYLIALKFSGLETHLESIDRMQLFNQAYILANMEIFYEIIRIAITAALFTFLILMIPEILLAGSIGKFILKLRIASANRTPAGYYKLIIRFLAKHAWFLVLAPAYFVKAEFLSWLFIILFLSTIVGCFYALSPKAQAFHDMLAGTAVFRTRDLLK
ncbi:MAG: hypothetical protein HW421_2673 [Ignavibacteria bacterium]|nr:hypothetical protein [Ignavibacteria bacterium]